ncbi:RNA helicase [Aspergillus sclerotialis]|uniref:ATP-dependent RNA helicase n=1 Tax=Aspergillus sclerotialis TaxID=2070753 RepID=A0A3A2ZC71_9EURO|nr:RNA helicase [Aspergillus sclerotialis]
MLSAIRRYGVAQALRASVPRTLQVRSTPQLLKWQPSSISSIPSLARPFHYLPATRSSASASAQLDDPVQSEIEPLREFADLQKQGLVDPQIVNTITRKMKISTMTDVQSMTLRETLKGDDVLAQAKTGTGKTLAFLIPILQNIMNNQPIGRHTRRRGRENGISAIVISPTRELAEQIAVQARMLAAGTAVMVQTAVGGSGKREGLRRIQREGCDLLIATPGRLQDILTDPMAGIKTTNVSAFVLDEADRLLDEGFAPAIMDIQSLLPDPSKVDRQTLLFSATVPAEVMHMVRRTMKPDFSFVKTVRDDEVPTHQSVPQKAVILHGNENALPAVIELVKNYQAQAKEDSSLRPFKAIVYYNSTAQVALVHEALSNLMDLMGRDRRNFLGGTRVYGIHGRLTQAQRTAAANSFRRSDSALLISSDVTARGMDFPEVTHVIQVGAPADKHTYIHRLGRTARANKTGEGWIFHSREEADTLSNMLSGLPVQYGDRSLDTAAVNMTRALDIAPSAAADIIDQVNSAMKGVDPQTKEKAYLSQMQGRGYRNKRAMIRVLNQLAVYGYQMPQPPSISPFLARKLGVDGVPGVNVSSRIPYSDMVGGERRMSRGGLGRRGSGGFGSRKFGHSFMSDRGRGPGAYGDRPSRPSFTSDQNDARRRGGDLSF